MADDPAYIVTDAAPPRAASMPRRTRFSEVLEDLASRNAERITIGDILAAFGDRAFGALMLVFAAPNMLPLPPGSSSVLGFPLLFITAQLMIGRSVLWLPRFITQRSLKRADFTAMVARLAPLLTRCERYLRPRLTLFVGPVQDRFIGAACFLLSIVLFLPIPFGNIPPAVAMSAFALGLIERDGVAVTAGWLATLGSLLILAVISTAIAAAVTAFFQELARLI